MDELTIVEGPAGAPPAAPPRATWLLAGRYEVLGHLARGGSGVVERALDRFTGREVVVKWLPAVSTGDLERIRREITSLRWLRLPGVVRLLHDGHDSFGWYIVMERVEGEPFPGIATPVDWSRLEGPTLDLLRVLVRVHAASILHADLKPGNVLVGRDGRVVVLDFGISFWTDRPPPEERSGTPGFMAPEVRTGRRDERSDLYSVGVMLAYALTGRAGPLASAAAPGPVVDLINELIDPDPDRRPESAAAVLERLGAPLRSPAPDGPASEEDLRALFAGPEEFLHLRTEGARVLFQRTQGLQSAVTAELARWEADGVAFRVEDGLRVDLVALDALDEREEETRLRGLLDRGAPAAEVVEEALQVANWWTTTGRPRRATSVIERALRVAREAEDSAGEARLLTAWTRAALAQESSPAFNRAIVEIRRSPWRTLALDDLEAMLRAYEAYFEGRPRDMAEQLGAVGPLQDEELEIWRMGLRIRLARQKTREEQALLDLEAWADTPGKRARWMAWMGNLRYQQGRFAEAAQLHLESAPARPNRGAWLSAVLNAAQALLEVPDLERARALGLTIQAESRASGLATYEALATRIVRVADYRAGVLVDPAPHLVDAASHLQPTTEGILGLAEAAIAWRRGDRQLAGSLAARAAAAYRTGNLRPFASFCAALALACRGGTPSDWAPLIVDSERMIVAHRLQVLALAVSSCPHPDPAWTVAIDSLISNIPASRRDLRLDVLSPSECAATCRQV